MKSRIFGSLSRPRGNVSRVLRAGLQTLKSSLGGSRLDGGQAVAGPCADARPRQSDRSLPPVAAAAGPLCPWASPAKNAQRSPGPPPAARGSRIAGGFLGRAPEAQPSRKPPRFPELPSERREHASPGTEDELCFKQKRRHWPGHQTTGFGTESELAAVSACSSLSVPVKL
ncbi:unnamed protein product [Rangifer tarandus platyrhynchus]|uniref:Uncharacterized protein n=2 Tax=Rangifer tarandus platyrhynchus TaxID=3082113 RepID=A0ABN8YG01_RANTA|nr:unnamed protein product [Rangifer tarandus platyrhynchus]